MKPLAIALLALLLAAAAPGPASQARAQAQAPTPAAIFGFRPGDDYRLADHGQIVAYFEALDAASDRVIVERIGESTLRRPMILALISSEANLRDRERYREIARRLARANDLDEADARRLAREGKSIVWIDGGLHATEVAGAQHTPELAYWLATDEGDEARRIRDETILLLMPVMNPDGLDIVASWYRGNVGTPYETAPVPELYHHYIGHDNNRDWYMFTQVETRAVARQLYHEWFPQIVYNHHQSGPFPSRIWIPPFEDPVNPNLDPLVVSGINQLGESMRKRFDEEGKPGVSSGITYDLWWNGSMRGGPDFHNMLGFLSETALYRYATPHCYGPDEVPETFGARNRGLPAKTPSHSYNNPWPGGCWRLRDPIEYMLTADRAVLGMAAKQREEYLYNIYRMGRRQTERGQRAEGGPFAYVIDPGAQHDPGAAVELLRIFRIAGIEVRRADSSFRAGGREYPAGVYVIGPQAFRPFVVDLIEPKVYPDRRQYPGGPPQPPYDMTGYELSLQMGVAVDRVREPFTLPAAVVDEVPQAVGGVEGRGRWGYLLARTSNAAARAVNRLLAAGARVSVAGAPFAGSLVIRGADAERVAALGRELGLTFHALDRAPDAPLRTLRPPRIGLYRSHVASMDEGWIRWLLEREGFTFENLSDDDVASGDLRRYHAIVLPAQGAEEIRDGHAPGSMPERYVGGLGKAGGESLRRYVAGGGRLVAIDEAVDYAIELFGLPVRNAAAELRPAEFFIPGSLLRLEVDVADPLAAGMPDTAIALFARSQFFELLPGVASREGDAGVGEPDVYVRYAARGVLASGWALGAEERMAGRPAAVRIPVGRGNVVLLGFRPHFRGQPHNTFKLLFNPLLEAGLR